MKKNGKIKDILHGKLRQLGEVRDGVAKVTHTKESLDMLLQELRVFAVDFSHCSILGNL